MKVLVTQACPTLCSPVDCSLPGSSVHGILQAKILEWVAIPFSRGPSWPRNWTWVSCIAGRFFIPESPEKPKEMLALGYLILLKHTMKLQWWVSICCGNRWINEGNKNLEVNPLMCGHLVYDKWVRKNNSKIGLKKLVNSWGKKLIRVPSDTMY